MSGFDSGNHIVLPSPSVELVVSLDGHLRISSLATSGHFESYPALVAGPRTTSSVMAHEGGAHDLTVSLTPDGARLLGLPAADLANNIVSLDQVWGREADAFLHRIREAKGWRARFDVLDDALCRRFGDVPAPGPISRSWRTLVATGGAVRVGDLAGQVGYGRRRFHQLFTADYGITPKQAARLIRFQRSVAEVRANESRGAGAAERVTLATVAADTGYCDQSHMTREWRELAGYSPTGWLDAEVLPFVQDAGERSRDDR